jgi:GxxExxY protein
MADRDPFTDEANNSFDTPPAAPRDDDTPRHRGTEAYKHDPLTHRIIGCAIEVHRQLGPGLFEHTYEEALCLELTEARLSFVRQVGFPVYYKGHLIGEHRPDLVVQDNVVVEVKSVERLIAVHQAQLLAYMRLLKKPVGLLLNFNSDVLRTGIRRLAI